jgi:hypothetical protein
MKFCPTCSNYLYLENKKDEDGSNLGNLEYKCHNCLYAEDCDDFHEEITKNTTIDTTDFIYDKTFMRTKAIRCPKIGCVCPEVLYFRQKHTPQMLYVCCNPTCQHQWTKATADGDVMDEKGDDAEGEGDEMDEEGEGDD